MFFATSRRISGLDGAVMLFMFLKSKIFFGADVVLLKGGYIESFVVKS